MSETRLQPAYQVMAPKSNPLTSAGMETAESAYQGQITRVPKRNAPIHDQRGTRAIARLVNPPSSFPNADPPHMPCSRK
jgi:hypothetical protein